jgi:hypothetical protein
MKKLLVVTAIFLFAGTAFGQTLQKGSVLGVHHATITLNEGVTMKDFIDFSINKMFPAVEKSFEGVKMLLLKGDRGENANEIGFLWYFDSLKDRDVYFTPEGQLTEKGLAAQEKLQPLMEEGAKLGSYTTTHTDWIIQ